MKYHFKNQPTNEELELIKDHFEAKGYGRIDDFTAAAQSSVLKRIREGKLNGKSKEERDTIDTSDRT